MAGFFVWLTCAFVVFNARPAHASDEAKEDANVLLTKAAALVDLQAPDAAPYMMLAKVEIHEGGKSVEGVYAVASAGPGKSRRVFRIPNFTSTEVITDGSTYIERSTEALPLPIWEANQLLVPADLYRPDSKWILQRVEHDHAGTLQLTCTIFRADLSDARLCVNVATGEPYSVDRHSDATHFSAVHERFEFADYQPFEGRTFPRKLTFHGWNSQVVEVQVQKLFRADSFPADEFVSPQKAVRFPYCASPETKGELRPSTHGSIPFGFRDIRIDIYFQVSAEGGIRYAQVVYSSDPLHSNEILGWFVGTHFPIRSCAGTPIPYETVTTLAFGH